MLALIVMACAACDKEDKAAPTASPAPPAMPVSVAEVVQKEIKEWDEFTGKLEAVDHVEIRPRVSGAIDKIHFKEGVEVKAGDPLFQIDPRPFEAELSRAEADADAARRREQRLLERDERVHRVVVAARERAASRARAAGERAQVDARREVAARSGDDRDRDLLVRARRAQRVGELPGAVARAGQGQQGSGTRRPDGVAQGLAGLSQRALDLAALDQLLGPGIDVVVHRRRAG